MIMKKQDKIVVTATILFLTYTLSLCLLGPVVSSLQANKTIGSSGSIQAIGVGVYSDSGCTTALKSLNWGMISPNSTQNITCYVKNTGNQTITLSMSSSNWNPANSTKFMIFTWNLQNTTLTAGQSKPAVFTLAVLASIQGITNFSFNVTIVGSS
jgi:hypothetical protein